MCYPDVRFQIDRNNVLSLRGRHLHDCAGYQYAQSCSHIGTEQVPYLSCHELSHHCFFICKYRNSEQFYVVMTTLLSTISYRYLAN